MTSKTLWNNGHCESTEPECHQLSQISCILSFFRWASSKLYNSLIMVFKRNSNMSSVRPHRFFMTSKSWSHHSTYSNIKHCHYSRSLNLKYGQCAWRLNLESWLCRVSIVELMHVLEQMPGSVIFRQYCSYCKHLATEKTCEDRLFAACRYSRTALGRNDSIKHFSIPPPISFCSCLMLDNQVPSDRKIQNNKV